MTPKVALAVRGVTVALLALMTALTALQVVLRYIFSAPLPWAEELVRYSFIYVIFLGAALGVHYGAHVRIDSLVKKLSGSYQRIVTQITSLLILSFLVFLVLAGFNLSLSSMNQTSPALGIPMGLAYLAIPLGAALSIYFLYSNKSGKSEAPIEGVSS